MKLAGWITRVKSIEVRTRIIGHDYVGDKKDNLGGIVVGAEPWVTNSSIDSLGEDENMSLHLEAFYQYRLWDNLAITPGLVWITTPSNNDREDDLVIGAIRTTFSS